MTKGKPKKTYNIKIKNETSERRQCLAYLRLNNFRVWIANTGAMKADYVDKLGCSRTRFVRFGEKGFPDIHGYIPGKLAIAFYYEVKVGSNRPTKDQYDFLNQAKIDGCYANWGDLNKLIKFVNHIKQELKS